MSRWKKALLIAVVLAGAFVVACAGIAGPCWTAWALDGILVRRCPAGSVRPVVAAEVVDLGRKDEGYVYVNVDGYYWSAHRERVQTATVRRFGVDLTLIAPDGTETPIKPVKGWSSVGSSRRQAKVRLPDVPDGDYRLRVLADSAAGDATVDVPLALYQPALGHVLTDSPVYKPGQLVQFRALLLGEGDLVPLDGRPGTWKVSAPDGELLLEEKGKTAAFGVASATFPLDAGAQSGLWHVRFESGAVAAAASFEVKTFQLPRFTVEAASARPAWHIGDRPVVEGKVLYTSGAPVANAPVSVRVRASGAWPPPPAWLVERATRTDARGRFRIELDTVPADLRDTATLSFQLAAVDATGDAASGSASVLLSADRLGVSAVTELADGLVASTNNRVYLRVTTPEGTPLRGARVKVRRAWDSGDPGLSAEADADGVARFQLDPGEPITVVVPPMPVRPVPRQFASTVRVHSATEILSGESLDLAGQSALSRWRLALEGCADRVMPGYTEDVTVAALIAPNGRVQVVRASGVSLAGDAVEDPLSRCFAGAIAGFSAPAGREQVWSIRFAVSDPESPWVTAAAQGLVGRPADVPDFDERLRDARGCVASATTAAELPRALVWRTTKGLTGIDATWVDRDDSSGWVTPREAACIERALAGVTLAEPAEASSMGVSEFSVQLPASSAPAEPQPTTFPGFEYAVSAVSGDEPAVTTTLRFTVGAVPTLRLRASEVLVKPGDTVEFSAIRGPDFTSDFPKKAVLAQGRRELAKFDFDPKARKGSVVIPGDASGFVHVEILGVRSVLYVQPKATLKVALSTDAGVYEPGALTNLTVRTTDGEGPVAAGVSLSGVDSTLATLAPLPKPDALADVTVRAASALPAFGVLDARALQTGMIRGDNAAQAAILRVTGLPEQAPGADRVRGVARGVFDQDGETADAFYALYGHARDEVRAWEGTAKPEDLLTAAKMVSLWEKALAAHPATDAFGRPLHLKALPPDLRPLTDPRFMVSDGARLPEDVENWIVYVNEGAP